ncbi:formylglycine-generating enzyme family protein, partial [Fusobacterium periodonticum]
AMNEGTFDYIFAGSNEINEVAWYRNNTGGKEEIQMGIAKVLNGGSTQEVGLKKPNQLGIYDCSGNVWEWIYDTAENSHRNLENKKLYTYRAFDNSCIHRRIRGGGWAARYESCSVSTRYYKINRGNGWDFSFSQIIDTCNQDTLKVSSDIGLRIVRTI